MKEITKKKSKPLQWVILCILIFIFGGIMVENMHSAQEYSMKLNTSQTKIRKDASVLLTQVQSKPQIKIAYALAYHSFLQSDFKLSYKQMLPYALTGNANAILVMGFLNEFGQGVPKNLKDAALWYYVGIHQNKYNKRPILRGLHAYNEGDYENAAQWFRMANELAVIRA